MVISQLLNQIRTNISMGLSNGQSLSNIRKKIVKDIEEYYNLKYINKKQYVVLKKMLERIDVLSNKLDSLNEEYQNTLRSIDIRANKLVINNLGPIIGDVAGSYFEVLEIKHKKEYHTNRPYEERIKILNTDTDLFIPESSYTDDTVLTCAIYDAIKNGNCEYEKYLRQYGLKEINLGVDKYGRSRFGSGFVDWLKGDYQGNSYGNGAAMRISPVGFLFDDFDRVREEAYNATIQSHNHPSALIGAEAVAVAINLLRQGESKKDVLDYIAKYYYHFFPDMDLETLQRTYTFSSKTSESVPQAFYVFSQADSFEDAIRKAISIGGDADTIACIVGGLAEAYYKVPDNLKKEVISYLDNNYIRLLRGDKNGESSKEINRVK